MDKLHPWSQKSVLIVDDSPKVLAQLSSLYEQAGMIVIGKATNGVEAIDMIRKTPPDLVSLDIIMPEMNGLECYRFIQTTWPGTKCLFISRLASELDVVESFKEEIAGHLFLPKPASIGNLENRLGRIFCEERAPRPEDGETVLIP